MPNVTFDTKYLMKRIGGKMTLDKLQDQLYKMGFETESADDKEIKIEVTANRPDLLGAVGMARALRYFTHKERRYLRSIKGSAPALTIAVDDSVKGYRPFISGMVVTGVDLGAEALADLLNFIDKLCDTFGRQRKKLAIGVHSLDAIKGDLTYTIAKDEKMLVLRGKAQMPYSRIVRQSEKGIKYSGTIDEKRGYPVLKDGLGTLALIPIINSDRTKLTTKTRNLFVDITGTSDYLVGKAADMLASIFMELSGIVGSIAVKRNGETRTYPLMEHQQFLVPLSMLEGEIGARIGFNNVLELANKMGYDAAFVNNRVRFTVPEYRLDIINEQDIIEDIAIAYGYEYINPVPVPSIGAGVLESRESLFEKASEALVGMGFSEAMNSYLSNSATNFAKMSRKPAEDEAVTIKDAKSANIEMLRTALLPSLLSNLSLSRHEKMPQRMFELDMAFHVKDKRPVESYHAAAVSLDSSSNFNYSKSVVTALLHVLGAAFDVKAATDPSFIDGRCAAVVAKGKQIGVFGELHPRVLRSFGIEEPAVAFEIDLTTLY